MELIISSRNMKVLFILFLTTVGSVQSFSYPEEKVEDQAFTWPTGMAFHETKTNSMLGEALLKRIYTRIEHTENLFRVEIGQIYDKLKNEIHKNFRKCDRQRRKVDHPKGNNHTSHASLSNDDKIKQKRDKKKRKKEKNNDRLNWVKRPYEPWPERERERERDAHQSQYSSN